MKTCININHPDIIKLSKDLNIPKTVVAAKIALWQKENNNYEKFPTLEHLVKNSNFYKNNEERFSPYSIEEIIEFKDVFLKEKYFYDSDIKSSEELLTMIAASEHPLNKVAEHLIPYVQNIANVDIELVDEILNVDGSIRNNLSGAYYQDYNGKPMIFIRKTSSFRNGGSEPTIIHEILHSLTVEALSRDNETIKQFEELYNKALNYLGPYNEQTNEGYYALKNVREFIVALFTDSKFIKALSEIPSTNNNKPSLLQEIFDYILSILNIDTENSLYKDAYNVATNILNEAVWFETNKREYENELKKYNEYIKKVGSDYPIKIDEGYDPTIFYNVEDYYIPLNYKTNLKEYKQFNLLNSKNELKTIPYKSIDDVNKAIKLVNTLNNNEKYKFQLKKFAKNGKEVYHILIFNKKPNDVLFDQSEKETIKDTNEKQYNKVNTPKKENIKFNIIHDKKLSPFAETVAKEILEYDAYYKAKKIAERKGASKEEIAEYKAIIESESFKKMIDTPLNLGHPSEILKAAGMADLPIMVSREHFQEHIIEEVRHKISKAEEVQQIVRDINSPLAIYRNREENGSYQNKYEILTGSANDKGDKIVFILQSDVRIESYKDTVMGTVKNIMGNKVITGFAVPNLGRLEAATHNKDLLFANSSYLENTYDNAKNRDLAKKHGNIKYTLDNLKRVLNLINNFSNPTPILKIRFDSQQLGTLNGDLNGELIQSLIDKLQSTFSQFKNISIVYNISEFAERAREYGINESSIQQLTDSKGNVYGAVLPDGTIYIDKNNFNVSTLIHEHSHLWNQVVKKTKPKLWEQIKKAIKKTQYWSDVVNNEDYDYLNGDEDAIADEAFARLVGDYSNDNWQGILELSNNNKSLFNQILQLLQEYFNFIVETLGFESNLKAEDFAKLSLFEMISGQPLKINSPNIDKQFNELSSDIKETFKSELLDIHKIVNSGFERSSDIGTLVNMIQIKRGHRNREGYMRAPNGVLTNLSENDWLYVRTDEFTSRHGDWFNQDASFTYNLDKNGEPILSQAKQSEPVIRFAKIRNERLFKHIRDNIHIEGVDTIDIYKSLMSAGFNSWDFEDTQIPFIKDLVDRLYNVKNDVVELKRQFNLAEFEETTNGKLINLKTVEDVEKYKKYYRTKELLCTFNNIENRLENYDIWVFIKNDVDNIEPSFIPERNDEYSTSVMMFQRKKESNKGSDYIISRYNHSVDKPNFLFNAVFDNFYEGLSEYLGQDLKNVNNTLSTDYVIQNNKIYKYDTEIDGNVYHYSKTGILFNGNLISLNPDYQIYYKYGTYIDTKKKNIIIDVMEGETLFHPDNKSLTINKDGIFGDNGQMLTKTTLKSNIETLDTNLYSLYALIKYVEYPELTIVNSSFKVPPGIEFLDISKLKFIKGNVNIEASKINFSESWKDGTGIIEGSAHFHQDNDLYLDTISGIVILQENAKLKLKTLGNEDDIALIDGSQTFNNTTLIVENALHSIDANDKSKLFIKNGTHINLNDNSSLIADNLITLLTQDSSKAFVNICDKVTAEEVSEITINTINKEIGKRSNSIILANNIKNQIIDIPSEGPYKIRKWPPLRPLNILDNHEYNRLLEIDDKLDLLNLLFDDDNTSTKKLYIDKVSLIIDALNALPLKYKSIPIDEININELPLILQHLLKNPILEGNTLQSKVNNLLFYDAHLSNVKKNTSELYPLIKYPIKNLKLKEHKSITAEEFIEPYKNKIYEPHNVGRLKEIIRDFNHKKGFNNIKLIERFDGNYVVTVNNEDTVKIRKSILKHLDHNQYEELDRPWFHYIKLPITQEFKIRHDNIFFNLSDELAPIYILENELDGIYYREVIEYFKKELGIDNNNFYFLGNLTKYFNDKQAEFLNNYQGHLINGKPVIFYMKNGEISSYDNGGTEVYINTKEFEKNDEYGTVIMNSNVKNNIVPLPENRQIMIIEKRRKTDDYYIESLINKYKVSNYLLLEEAELLKDKLEKRMKIDKQSYTITFDKNGNFVKLIFTMNDDNILSNLNFSPSIINNLLVNNIVLEDYPNQYRKVLHSKVLNNELNDDFTCTI